MIFKRSEIFRKISKKTFLVEAFYYVITTLNSQSVIWPEEGIYHRFFLEKIFENGWLWTAASEQSKQKISKQTLLVELL